MPAEITREQREYPMDGWLRIRTSREKPVGIATVALGAILLAGGVTGLILSCTYGQDWGSIPTGGREGEELPWAFFSGCGSFVSGMIGGLLLLHGSERLNGGLRKCERSYSQEEAEKRRNKLHSGITCRSLEQWLHSRGGVASLVRSGVLLPDQGDKLRGIMDLWDWNPREEAWRLFQRSILTDKERTEFDAKRKEMSDALFRAIKERRLDQFGPYLEHNGGVEVLIALGILSVEEAYELSRALRKGLAESAQASLLQSFQAKHLSAQSPEADRASSTLDSSASN